MHLRVERGQPRAPALVATVAPGRTTASVRVAGEMPDADFPGIHREWDPVANNSWLDTIKAGRGN